MGVFLCYNGEVEKFEVSAQKSYEKVNLFQIERHKCIRYTVTKIILTKKRRLENIQWKSIIHLMK